MDFSGKINRLMQIARFGQHPFMNMGPTAAIKVFGENNDAVSFIAVGVLKEFDAITQSLFQSASIGDNYTLEGFQNELAGLLRMLNKERRDANNEDWKKFLGHVFDKPVISLKIVAPIHGITMSCDSIRLGDFFLFKTSAFTEVMGGEALEIILPAISAGATAESYRIGVTVTAKERAKCYESANKLLNTFENVGNFIVGGFHNYRRIGIFNYSSPKSTSLLSLSPGNSESIEAPAIKFDVVSIDDPVFKSDQLGNQQLWRWITAGDTDLQKKLILAAEWCGKALVDTDNSKALIQYVISLESLLQYDESDFIRPSIVSQLTDMISFLLGETYEQRVSFSKYVKDLYRKRSLINHKGSTAVDEMDLHTANVVVHKVIRKIVTSDPFSKFKSKKELCEHLNKMKYGFGRDVAGTASPSFVPHLYLKNITVS